MKLTKSTEEENSGADAAWLFLGSAFSLPLPSLCYLKLTPHMFLWPLVSPYVHLNYVLGKVKAGVADYLANMCISISHPAVHSY